MGDVKDICEARIDHQWRPMSINEVLGLDPRPLLRCAECHGRVRAHKEANNGMRAHFEHFERHDGCSLKTNFNSVRKPHPAALS